MKTICRLWCGSMLSLVIMRGASSVLLRLLHQRSLCGLILTLICFNISCPCMWLVCFFPLRGDEGMTSASAQCYKANSPRLCYPCFSKPCLCVSICPSVSIFTHASGGLILITRQASKCLCLCVFFFASDIQCCSVQRCYQCMANNHHWFWDRIWFLSQSVWLIVLSYVVALHSFYLSMPFSATGCLDLWRGGRAVQRRTCVTCLQKWTPSSQLWPSSTLSTKSCWGHSYADEDREKFQD